MATAVALAGAESRVSVRDEVHYRTRGFGPDANALSLLIVNVSACGMMARTAAHYTVGERLRVTLPVVGVVVAEIRWALGGRIGCELERPIALSVYDDVLAAMVKGR